jgi:hypothetical protein
LLITNLSPRETQLLSGLGTSTAKDVLHQWLTETLKSTAANSYVEGVDATFPARGEATRYYNVSQIIRVGYEVTDTERAIVAAGYSDRYAHEAQKALKEWSNDAEYALMRGTIACGATNVARSMKGVKQFMGSNNYSNTCGASLLEAGLNNYLQGVWDDGTEVNAIYVPMKLKRVISGFTAGATKNVETTDKRLVNAVDVYEADAASMVKLFAHRYVYDSSFDTGYDMIGLDESKWRVAYLRKPFTRELSKTGDATKGEVVGELTLECLHKDAGFVAANFLS